MKPTQTLGLIVENNVTGVAERPILGRTCRQHVRQALLDSHVLLAEDASAFNMPFDVLLLVREDAPCLTPALLSSLVGGVRNGTASSGVLMSHKREAIAMAMPREKWFAAVKSYALTPQEISKMLLGSRDEKGSAVGRKPDASESCFAVSDAVSYADAYAILRQAIVQRHLEAGVLLLDPARTVIEAEVEIAPGVLVYPDNLLMGQTRIGPGCTLYPNNRMESAVIGSNTTIENSVLIRCTVGSSTTVGPFAYLRPDSHVGDHCRIGDFVEVKNSTIGDGTKVSHLTYVGDSDLGKDINLGCGVVFVNYDGKTKNRCVVEDNAFVGCNCNLVAPVRIGENAYLAAGSTVVEDVPADALYVARSRGTTKEDWVTKRKEAGLL